MSHKDAIAQNANCWHFNSEPPYTMTIALDQIRQLPVGQRIQLVEDIWDTINEDAEISLSSGQLAELDKRRAEMMADPTIGIPWAEAKARLLAGGA